MAELVDRLCKIDGLLDSAGSLLDSSELNSESASIAVLCMSVRLSLHRSISIHLGFMGLLSYVGLELCRYLENV